MEKGCGGCRVRGTSTADVVHGMQEQTFVDEKHSVQFRVSLENVL